MRSWQRRMALADRRFSWHATVAGQSADGATPDGSASTEPTGEHRADPPSAAVMLAAMLRDDRIVSPLTGSAARLQRSEAVLSGSV
jgi:hypothetical protein